MSVDAEMYEAAELDGANKFQQFLHIILPSIKTIVTLNVILSITGALSHTLSQTVQTEQQLTSST